MAAKSTVPLQQTLERDKDHIRKCRFDTIRSNGRSKPDFREIAKRLLFNTPSQTMQGEKPATAHKELDEIQLAARVILELGMIVSVPTDVSNCACVHLYSFYKCQAIQEVDRNYVAIACLFLACKTEDHPRALNDLIIGAYNIMHERRCKEALQQRAHINRKMEEVSANISYHSIPNSVGTPPSVAGTDESASPCSTRSNMSDPSLIGASPYGIPRDAASRLKHSHHHITSPGSMASSSTSGGQGQTAQNHNASSQQQLQSQRFQLEQLSRDLKRLPQVRCLSRQNKREYVVPPDDFFWKLRPIIEEYEMVLLMTIGFETYINLPHTLIVSSRDRFCNVYGESMRPKIDRIAPIAYDLATRVVSLIPVQRPRNCIAAALIFLCGPFRHPIDNKTWWRDIYAADITEQELKDLAALICDAWIATRDYYHQVHEIPRMQRRKEEKARRMSAMPVMQAAPAHVLKNMQQRRSPSPSPSGNSLGPVDPMPDFTAGQGQIGHVRNQYHNQVKGIPPQQLHHQKHLQNSNNHGRKSLPPHFTTSTSHQAQHTLNAQRPPNTAQNIRQHSPNPEKIAMRQLYVSPERKRPGAHQHSGAHNHQGQRVSHPLHGKRKNRGGKGDTGGSGQIGLPATGPDGFSGPKRHKNF